MRQNTLKFLCTALGWKSQNQAVGLYMALIYIVTLNKFVYNRKGSKMIKSLVFRQKTTKKFLQECFIQNVPPDYSLHIM